MLYRLHYSEIRLAWYRVYRHFVTSLNKQKAELLRTSELPTAACNMQSKMQTGTQSFATVITGKGSRSVL